MGCLKALLCIICPPIAVIDKGCAVVLLVTAITICGWVPGVVVAFLICLDSKVTRSRRYRFRH